MRPKPLIATFTVIFKVLLLSVIIIMTSYTNVNCENIHFRKFYQLVLIHIVVAYSIYAKEVILW